MYSLIRLLAYYLSCMAVHWWNSYYLICDSNGIRAHSHLVRKWTLSHLATSDMTLASNKEFLDIQGNYRMWIHSETRKWCMIIPYSQMHRTDRYSHLSSISWPVWLNCWVFVYKLSSCGFESRCCHWNLRYDACFGQGVPWHKGKL